MEGIAKNKVEFKIRRIEEEVVELWKGIINSLQREQKSAKEVKEWYECGMKIRSSVQIQEWDILEFLEMQEVSQD
jgi:translation initiation factor IF-2